MSEVGWIAIPQWILTVAMLTSLALGILIGLLVGAIVVIKTFTRHVAEQVVRVQVVPVLPSKKGDKVHDTCRQPI